MDLEIGGKVAWVLGGSSGLGRGCAEALAREGATVAISSRGEDKLKQVASEIGDSCIPVSLDVTDAAAIDRAATEIASRLGPVDILVANAGGPPAGTFDDFDDRALHEAFELTAASAWRLAAAVIPSMKERGTGVVVFITSSSTKEPISGLLLSNMMRPAVVGMAKTLSKELGQHGVRVLCVAPGRIETPRTAALGHAGVEAIPLGRLGQPPELGDVVAFLASARASYVTGVTVLVDGGASSGLLS
ncbi:MAG TPA: SDR family oxidoreductase [Actinomycetota bacterium]|nr:SDR family oxidoreductase [Actinomycetota bacterium]